MTDHERIHQVLGELAVDEELSESILLRLIADVRRETKEKVRQDVLDMLDGMVCGESADCDTNDYLRYLVKYHL